LSRLEQIKSKDRLVHSRTENTKEPISFSKFYMFLTIVCLGGIIYLIFFSGLLDIKKIDVVGYTHGETIKDMATEEVSRNMFTGNIIIFNTSGLREKLTGDPNIKKIYIRKIYPNTLRVEVEESKPALIWISAGDKMLVDDRGVIMGKAGVETTGLIEIYDASNIVVKAGERVASPTFIKFINDIKLGFDAATGTKLIKITLLDLIEDVHILSSDGWTVYLNASISAEAQLKNLTRVLTEASKEKKKLEYIDMRLRDKIFYK
jgi:cell division septal protein FtsQ